MLFFCDIFMLFSQGWQGYVQIGKIRLQENFNQARVWLIIVFKKTLKVTFHLYCHFFIQYILFKQQKWIHKVI